MEHWRVGVLERLAIEPPRKPIQMREVGQDKASNRQKRPVIGLHVVGEFDGEKLLDQIEVKSEEDCRINRGPCARIQPGHAAIFTPAGNGYLGACLEPKQNPPETGMRKYPVRFAIAGVKRGPDAPYDLRYVARNRGRMRT